MQKERIAKLQAKQTVAVSPPIPPLKGDHFPGYDVPGHATTLVATQQPDRALHCENTVKMGPFPGTYDTNELADSPAPCTLHPARRARHAPNYWAQGPKFEGARQLPPPPLPGSPAAARRPPACTPAATGVPRAADQPGRAADSAASARQRGHGARPRPQAERRP